MFGFGRRRSFDRQNDNDQNSTGYREKTVFTTDFGSPDNGGYSGGFAQNSAPQSNGYANQNNAYAQSASSGGTTTEVRELPMVFASREHSDIYIYEYSDRLEYYLKTATSMYLFNTVKKQ